MAFEDLGDALAGAHLDLPLNSKAHPDGRLYRIEDVTAETALMVEKLLGLGAALVSDDEDADIDTDILDDGDERDLYERLLGDAYAQMRADGVGWTAIKHAAMTVMAWVLQDQDAAEQYWRSGGGADALGEALTGRQQNRASRRASEAVARKTPRPGSTNGTNPRHRGRGKQRPGNPSRGPGSSPSGR
ncbi:DUF7426 family protein [Actinomadura macra]|uniref:DUF7426 family protein n=1 Tax=Actinomadura macra TaxID=46164 RepID=UPI00082E9931|nr:hypothetical protein [Actinomadura macra]